MLHAVMTARVRGFSIASTHYSRDLQRCYGDHWKTMNTDENCLGCVALAVNGPVNVGLRMGRNG